MRTNSNISKQVLLLAVSLPMLAVYITTTWCWAGHYLADCCKHHTNSEISQPAYGHDHSDEHHKQHKQHDHSKPDERKNKKDCCSDVTTAFFSVFRQQAQPYTINLRVQDAPPIPLMTVIPSGNPGFKIDFRQKWLPPPRAAPSGFSLRILHQSFLI